MTLYRLGHYFFWLLLWLISLTSEALTAQEITAPSQVQIAEGELESLLQQLESERYQVRLAASRQLEQFGLGITPALVSKILYGPPETAARCGRALSRIALSADRQNMTRIARILLLLSENGMQHFQRESLMLHTKWKKIQQDQTVELLSEAGITVRLTEFGTGFGGGVPWNTVIDSSQIEATKGTGEPEIPGSVASQPNTPEAAEILANVNAIISTSDAENERRFAETIRRVETGQKSARNSATLELDGDRIAWDESEQETFFNIVIEENSQFGTKEVDLLRRLPGSLQISFVKRDMSPTVLEALKTVNSLQYIALVNCRYDLKPMFGLWKERPDLVVSASGKEAFLGVQLDSRIAFETQQVCGVLEVIPNSAAAAAGIQAGDLFLRVNGIPVSRSEEVILAIGAFKPGDTLTLDLIRDEKEREMQIELRARPEEQ